MRKDSKIVLKRLLKDLNNENVTIAEIELFLRKGNLQIEDEEIHEDEEE